MRDIATNRFTSALVAYGVATTFVTWMLPFGVLLVDITQRPPTDTDLVMLASVLVVVGGSALFWVVVLSSERVTEWVVRCNETGVAGVWSSLARHWRHDPAPAFIEVRASLRAWRSSPGRAAARTAVAQSVVRSSCSWRCAAWVSVPNWARSSSPGCTSS